MKKRVSMIFGLFLVATACASNDDDNGGGSNAADASPFADSRPAADARPFVDAAPVPDGGGLPFGDGGLPFGDGGGFGCASDDDCEEGECCAELFPGAGFKVCIEKAEDAGPGECMLAFP